MSSVMVEERVEARCSVKLSEPELQLDSQQEHAEESPAKQQNQEDNGNLEPSPVQPKSEMRNLTGDKERGIATDSMVTVRLSDVPNGHCPVPQPSPAPTLKLVTETNTVEDVPESIADCIITESPVSRSRSGSESSTGSNREVDWDGLERNEDEESKDDHDQEEKTAFLIARLERENSRLENDPKSGGRQPEKRPPSLHQLKRLMTNPCPETMRYSMLPSPPPLTDLEFYGALVVDYKRCASKLPFLLSKKLRAGVPPPLRGVVWISMAGARDVLLENTYEQLSGEQSPYEQLIGKDVGRTGLEMFRQEGGEGQQLLGRVLRAFSLYDTQIGYCQGLGFLVGPLLMHMGEKEAFCVLVRLMEHYDLRSCFLPSLYGLRLRMYQFQSLLQVAAPDLYTHLETLGVQPTYASQWFLSFFAVNCPLPILLRIYDVIFAEGAAETIMRVALCLMRRNEQKLLAMTEFEDVLQMLLSRNLWDAYGFRADDLISDFDTLTGIVTREVLAELEARFKDENPEETAKAINEKEQGADSIRDAAARFLGRIWGGTTPQLALTPSAARPKSQLRKSNSKQSLTSTVSSYDSTASGASTIATTMSRSSSSHERPSSFRSTTFKRQNKDADLHSQIEDLLTAMSTLQRENQAKLEEIQALRLEHEEERASTRRLIELLQDGSFIGDGGSEINQLCEKLSAKFDSSPAAPIVSAAPLTNDTASQLAEELQRTREELAAESRRAKELAEKVEAQTADIQQMRQSMRDMKSRWETSQRDKQRLEKNLSDLRMRQGSFHDGGGDEPKSPSAWQTQTNGGLREFKLGRAASTKSQTQPVFNKRSSSLGIQSVLTTDNNDSNTPSNETLLMELVAAKTAEATAKQEAEEAKAKLQSLRLALKKSSGSSLALASPGLERTSSFGSFLSTSPPSTHTTPASSAASSTAGNGGMFSAWTGWGKK